MITSNIAWFENISLADVAQVGGKNAGLGELLRTVTPLGVRVPNGFACTAETYRTFVRVNDLEPRIRNAIAAWKLHRASLSETGASIRKLFLDGHWPAELASEITGAYRQLSALEGTTAIKVAVRSSATAEDLPDASFAGQQESFLNIEGEAAVLDACRRCFASLFTDRALVYRQNKGFDHLKVALSVGVQTLVCADPGAAGVMFTLDTETGFSGVVLINASYGLGEYVVQGRVSPDEFCVWKEGLRHSNLTPIISRRCGGKERMLRPGTSSAIPTVDSETPDDQRGRYCISDDDVIRLARWAMLIEQKMGRPMDIEWVKDSTSNALYVVQARPETVFARHAQASRYVLDGEGTVLLHGRSVGNKIASGAVCVVRDAQDLEQFVPGSILVAEMTDPDWVPVMRQARGIITDRGGRTCHAAIVSRELGIPAVIGTGNATSTLATGQIVTVDCASGSDATVYAGVMTWHEEDVVEAAAPQATRTRVMLNLAQPSTAFASASLPVDGVGLVRVEFIIGSEIGIHPMAFVRPSMLDDETRKRIAARHRDYEDGAQFFVETLARGVATIAASQFPKPVIVRMSDFKTNEYARLLGGSVFEPKEENPMLGFRGASRYYDDRYRDGFALECRAMKYAREVIGLTNIAIMIPFCRTPHEADRVLAVMADNGLTRGDKGLAVYVMCEIPSNVILAEEFARRFDGFSIGSNDLTQLTLGVDRGSEILAKLFDERDPAVMASIREVIHRAHACGATVGLCGQAPSDDPSFAEALVDAGIDSISVDPSSAIDVKAHVAAFELRRARVRCVR